MNICNNAMSLGTKVDDFISQLMPHSLKAFHMPEIPSYIESQIYSLRCESIKHDQDKNLSELKKQCFELNMKKNDKINLFSNKVAYINKHLEQNDEQKIRIDHDKSKYTNSLSQLINPTALFFLKILILK